MLPSFPRFLVFVAAGLLAACTTGTRTQQPGSSERHEKPAVGTTVTSEQPKAPANEKALPTAKPEVSKAISVGKKSESNPVTEKKVLCPAEPIPVLKEGEFAVWVDSDPKGGLVVVDGIPVGRAPQRVVLHGTARGFCRDEVSIKVRFVATDAGHISQTVEERLTPLDKIPARVRFSAQGAMRVAR